MSRKLRMEHVRLLQLNAEVVETVDVMKVRKERIYAPCHWRTTKDGIKIQDIKPQYYDEVVQMYEDCYLQEELLCRNILISENEESKNSYLEHISWNIKDTTSIMAVDPRNDNALVGALILKVCIKSEYARVNCRVRVTNGEGHQAIIRFISLINRRVDIYEEFDCNAFLEFMQLCIKPEYRHKGIGYQLMLSGLDVARSLGMPVIMGVFTSVRLQRLASRIGMKTMYEIYYTDWKDEDGEMIFPDPGAGNYTCALMAGPLSPPPPPPVEVVEDLTTRGYSKMTRAEKLAIKLKKIEKAAEDAERERLKLEKAAQASSQSAPQKAPSQSNTK